MGRRGRPVCTVRSKAAPPSIEILNAHENPRAAVVLPPPFFPSRPFFVPSTLRYSYEDISMSLGSARSIARSVYHPLSVPTNRRLNGKLVAPVHRNRRDARRTAREIDRLTDTGYHEADRLKDRRCPIRNCRSRIPTRRGVISRRRFRSRGFNRVRAISVYQLFLHVYV